MNRQQRRKLKATGQSHEALRSDLLAVLRRHNEMEGLPPEEVLAITANIVGMCLAFQNQRTMTKDRAMEIVIRNIEIGNATVVDELYRAPAHGNA